MNFREEYIKSVEEITPDRQAIDRMKENVLNITRRKRAFPLKTIAAFGGTAAACAVIALVSVHIAPRILKFDNTMIEYSATLGAPENTDSFAGDANGAPAADTNTSAKDNNYADTNEVWDGEEAFPEDDPNAMPATTVIPSAKNDSTDISDKEYSINDTPAVPSMDSAFSATEEAERFYESETLTPENSISQTEWDCPTMEAPSCETFPNEGLSSSLIKDTIPAGDLTASNELPDTGGCATFVGYTLTIAEDFSECTLTKGEQIFVYTHIEIDDYSDLADDIIVPYFILTNTTDGKTYYVALADGILIVRDEDYKLVELFE